MDPITEVLRGLLRHFRWREHEEGSNAGGGGGCTLVYASEDEADQARDALAQMGAGAWRAQFSVKVPDAAEVIQSYGGPVDGPTWPRRDDLRRAIAADTAARIQRWEAAVLALLSQVVIGQEGASKPRALLYALGAITCDRALALTGLALDLVARGSAAEVRS